MASPRERLRKLLRKGLLKTAQVAEAAAEAVAPAPVEAPAPLVDAPVVEEKSLHQRKQSTSKEKVGDH